LTSGPNPQTISGVGRHAGTPATSGRARSTIVDVAKAAHVHPSTVSRALNAQPGQLLRPETRARVVAAADRLGYRPSAIARSLRLQRTLTLGMLVPDIANTFLAGIIKGAEEAAHERGYSLVLCNTGDLPEREATYIRVLRERQVDGVLVASTRMADETIADLRADGFPFVLVNRAAGGRDDLVVTVDNTAAAGLVVDHFVSLGHTRIAHVAGPRSTTTGAERASGVAAAARRHGIEAKIVEAESWSEAGGFRAARGLFRESRPTAVFGANDLIALGVRRAAGEARLSVPRDLALAGFNDTPEASLADLTTIHVAQEEMGAQAARLLIARLEGEAIPARRIVLPAELVVRGSTSAGTATRRIA
jgi:LacI family transcriptional regulator